MLLSNPSTGPDCMMWRYLPEATPANTSNMTTSPNSFRPIRWASVPPMLPAPTRAILLRAIDVLPEAGAELGRPVQLTGTTPAGHPASRKANFVSPIMPGRQGGRRRNARQEGMAAHPAPQGQVQVRSGVPRPDSPGSAFLRAATRCVQMPAHLHL